MSKCFKSGDIFQDFSNFFVLYFLAEKTKADAMKLIDDAWGM